MWAPLAPAAKAATAVFDIRNFGASPDGVHDNSLAIQRAVAAAVDAGSGVVHFPCGEWRADEVLNGAPAQRSALYFDSIANVTFRGEGKCTCVFTTVAARTVFEIHASRNVSFENLRIEPMAAVFHEHYQNDGGSGIRLSGVDGGHIRNVEMSGGSAALLWMNAGTANYSVTKNYIHHGFGNSAIWEDDCSATDSSINCGASLPPHGNSIEDNLFVENGTTGGNAQVVLDSGGHVTGTRVVGNTIRGRPEPRNPHIHGIQVGNAGGALVERNQIVAVLDDGIAVTADDGVTISDTRILGNTIEGGCHDAAIILYASAGGRVERTVVRENHVSDVEGRGIVVAGVLASNITATDIVGNELSYPPAGGAALPADVLVLRGHGIRLMGNVVNSADAAQQLWIRIDPDASGVTGVPSVRRVGGGALLVFDPAGKSDSATKISVAPHVEP